jgi:hypothetical protein
LAKPRATKFGKILAKTVNPILNLQKVTVFVQWRWSCYFAFINYKLNVKRHGNWWYLVWSVQYCNRLRTGPGIQIRRFKIDVYAIRLSANGKIQIVNWDQLFVVQSWGDFIL